MNIEKLIESILCEDTVQRFDPEIEEKLYYLNSSKKKAGASDTTRVPFMDKVFASCKGVKTKKTIYRGLYKEEYEKHFAEAGGKIGQIIEFDRYKSFTEDLQCAKEFSKGYGMIMMKSHTGGFPYWRWFAEAQQELQVALNIPKQMHQTWIESVKYEKEWLFNIGVKLKIVGFPQLKGGRSVIQTEVVD